MRPPTTVRPPGAHAKALGGCEAVGCHRQATQTATHDNDPYPGRVRLCDQDAAYMATVPRYRAVGWGEHRARPVEDEPPVTELDARWHVDSHVRALLDAEDAALEAATSHELAPEVPTVVPEQRRRRARRVNDDEDIVAWLQGLNAEGADA